MKKIDYKKIALLGLATGLVLSGQTLTAHDLNITTAHLMVAKGCPGHGCPQKKLTASRDLPKSATSESVDTSLTEEMQKANDQNMNYKLLSEDELLLELSPDGTKQYLSLTPEGKALARYVASQMCNMTNACQGLNACETEKNKCAGKGSCKGQGKCAFSDKNLAVKVVTDKMAKKRAETNGNVPSK